MGIISNIRDHKDLDYQPLQPPPHLQEGRQGHVDLQSKKLTHYNLKVT